jgi:dipeptidase E
MQLLLISNSVGPDGGFLDHCAVELQEFLAGVLKLLFVPFAGGDEPAYGALACERLEQMGIRASWADRTGDPLRQLGQSDAVFLGGGNTFRLLDRLYSTGMLDAIRRSVADGTPYVGSSAGTNVAGPTIKTTNDMPIVQPPSFVALNLVPFQINPHYVDRDPDSSHQGETREERLFEYLAENDCPVVALREGAMLRISPNEVLLQGSRGARVYRQSQEPIEHSPGTRLDDLLTV